METKPTHEQAQLHLHVYEMRREARLRYGRDWFFKNYFADNFEDGMRIAPPGTENGALFMMVLGYWEMAASMVLHGAVNEELFMEPSFCGEMFFIFAKVRPFLNELRERFQSPSMFTNIEKLINKSEKSRELLKTFETRIANRRKAITEAARAAAS